MIAAGAVLDILKYGILLYVVYGIAALQAFPVLSASIVFATLIGTLVLKEQYARRRIIASIIIAASVVLLQV